MKIREGFVSNSSSSSFLVISKTNENLKIGNPAEEIEYHSVHIEGELSYCRSDIRLLETIEDKTEYIMAMYAYILDELENHECKLDKMEPILEKLYSLKEWIYEIGRKYNMKVTASLPLYKFQREEEYYDFEKRKFIDCKPFYEIYPLVYTEAGYISELREMIENNKEMLERFLFNPQSFAILGGDEYYDQLRPLEVSMRKKVNYDYDFISDCEKKDDWGVENIVGN